MYLNTSKPIDAGIVVSGNLTLTGYTLSVGGIGGNPIPWLYVVTYSVFSAWNPNSGAPSNPAFFSMDFIYVSALRTVLVPFNFTAPDSSIYYFLIGTYYPKTTFTLSAAYRSRAWWVTPLTFILGIPAGVLVLPEHTLRRLGKKFTRGSRRSRKEKNLGPRS